MHLVCFTDGATEFSSMRSSRLVGREINNQTINFSVNVSTKVAFVLTRGHEVSMVYHSLKNSVLPLCFVTARPPYIASVAELIRKKKQTNKQTRNNGGGIIL